MNWFKIMFKIGNIKEALVKIYSALSVSVNVLKGVKAQLDANNNKYAEDVGKVIDLCATIMGVIQTILTVLGTSVIVETKANSNFAVIDKKIDELKRIVI